MKIEESDNNMESKAQEHNELAQQQYLKGKKSSNSSKWPY